MQQHDRNKHAQGLKRGATEVCLYVNLNCSVWCLVECSVHTRRLQLLTLSGKDVVSNGVWRRRYCWPYAISAFSSQHCQMNLSLQLLEISHVVVLHRAEWVWYEVFAAWREALLMYRSKRVLLFAGIMGWKMSEFNYNHYNFNLNAIWSLNRGTKIEKVLEF